MERVVVGFGGIRGGSLGRIDVWGMVLFRGVGGMFNSRLTSLQHSEVLGSSGLALTANY